MIHMSVASTSHAKTEINEVYYECWEFQSSYLADPDMSVAASGQVRSGDMSSQADVAKRELVKVLRELAFSVESFRCPTFSVAAL